MKDELRKLYKEYHDAIFAAELYNHESDTGFFHWLITGEL